MHIIVYFINHLSALHGRPWNCAQANFTVGARGSLKQTQFQDRLRLLGVTSSKATDKIRVLTVSKTKPCRTSSSSLFTSPFCVAPSGLFILFRRNWPTRKRQHSNSSKIHQPIQWAGNLRSRIIGPLSPWGHRPIQRAAAYTDGPPFARPHVGRASPSGPSARGPITPCGLAARGAVL